MPISNSQQNNMEEKILISKELLQDLLSSFYTATYICKELNVYEHPDWQDQITENKEWVREVFGTSIDKKEY